MHLWTTHLEGGPRRVNHAAVVVQDYIYSFGGYCTGDNESDRPMDIHVLNTYKLVWSIITETKSERNRIPYHRYGHTAVAWSNSAYIFGGRNDRNGACNKLFRFKPATKTWSQLTVHGSIPGARDGHSACVIGDTMFIFGGYEEMAQMFSNEVYSFNFNLSEWTPLIIKEQPASWRDFHSATGIGDMMLVFGGRSDRFGPYHTNSEVYCNKLQIFKTSTNTWYEPPVKGTPPSGRRSHSAVAYEGDLYIFGGYNGLTNVHHNDMYKYSLSENRWSVVKAGGSQPCSRRRQCCCIVGQQMFLFGGTKPDPSAPDDRDAALIDLDDLHILDFKPTLRTICMVVVVSYKLDTSYLPKDIRFEIDCMASSRKIERIMTTSG